MRYLMLSELEIQTTPGLRQYLDVEPTQAQYELCSYAVPEDHPNLALILLVLPGQPHWDSLPLGSEPGRTRFIA